MDIDKDTLLMWSKFNYKFYEEGHYYIYKDKRVQISVTQFIKKFHKEFDEDKWSKYIAKKEGVSQQEILDRWKLAADLSAITGTLFHNRAEQLILNRVLSNNYDTLSDAVKERLKLLIPLQDKFFSDIEGKLIPLKTEFTVGIEDKIAGNVDLLVWNEKDQEIQVWDYKTNKEIKLDNKYDKMFYPFHNYDDCNFVHYSIQLNIYKYILETVLGIKIGKCYLAHFNENNPSYNLYKCLDLQKEVEIALKEKLTV